MCAVQGRPLRAVNDAGTCGGLLLVRSFLPAGSTYHRAMVSRLEEIEEALVTRLEASLTAAVRSPARPCRVLRVRFAAVPVGLMTRRAFVPRLRCVRVCCPPQQSLHGLPVRSAQRRCTPSHLWHRRTGGKCGAVAVVTRASKGLPVCHAHARCAVGPGRTWPNSLVFVIFGESSADVAERLRLRFRCAR
jgi:hypothetical protein